MKPFVAIVGKANVGKSTFFNKVSGDRKSIVLDVAGVTRDRLYADADRRNKRVYRDEPCLQCGGKELLLYHDDSGDRKNPVCTKSRQADIKIYVFFSAVD